MPDLLATTDRPVPDGLPEGLAAAALTLARGFEAGATLWCVSPGWPHHARHVAVEFVHPVIVGKRALPALTAPPGDDVVAAVRASARTGDLLLVIAEAGNPAARDLVRRSAAWGLRTVWVGTGPRPEDGAADHVLWLDDEHAPHDGRFILLYHLLWELTHVCLEQPGVLADPDACDDEVCVTCADEGVVAEVLRAGLQDAVVRTADADAVVVDTSLVGPVAPHDLLLVHAGVAISALGEDGGASP